MSLTTKPRPPLEGQHFQVVIIGGGINGVALARECARAGKRTLLVEQNDFASGVTSRSTRIIHGGLRYVEHGEIGLVRESVREREHLLRERSHLVHPVHFLFLLNEQSQRSAMKVRAGLWLYQRFAGKKSSALSEMELKRVERALDAGHQWSIFDYEDAQCEFPERLVAEWMMDAAEAGAVVRNHCEVLAVDVIQGRARGVLLRDRISGKDERVDAGWILNCTGPWADRICQRSAVRTSKPMLGGVRGSHIVRGVSAGFPRASGRRCCLAPVPLPSAPSPRPAGAVGRGHGDGSLFQTSASTFTCLSVAAMPSTLPAMPGSCPPGGHTRWRDAPDGSAASLCEPRPGGQ